MENILHELTTVTWSHKSYTPKELIAKQASFPIVVKTSSGIHCKEFCQNFHNDQILYLHCVKEQFRFVAWDVKQNEISIPINSPVTFLEPGSKDTKVILTEDMKLPQYIKVDLRHSTHELSQLRCLTEEDEIILNIKRRGWMKYLLGVSLSKTCLAHEQELWCSTSNSEVCTLNGEIGDCIESIPVECREMQLYIALDLRDETIEDFLKFESCVTDLVISTHQHQLDSCQGNTDFIINAQPNFIEMLAEISTAINLQEIERHKKVQKREIEANIYTDTNINNSPLHDMSTLKGSTKNCKKLQKKDKKTDYTMDESQMATSSYQNNIEDDLLSLENTKQTPDQKCREDKNNQFLSMDGKENAEVSHANNLQVNIIDNSHDKSTLKGSKLKNKKLHKNKEKTNLNTNVNKNDSHHHDKSTSTSSREKCKKLQKKEKNPHYTNINKSQISTSSYQNLISLGLSSDEYEYPEFNEGYENIEDDLLSLENAKQTQDHKYNDDKNDQTTKILSMDGKEMDAVYINDSFHDKSTLKGSKEKHKKLRKKKTKANLYIDMNTSDKKLQKKKEKQKTIKVYKSQMKDYEMMNENTIYNLLLEEAIQKPDYKCNEGKNRVSPSEDDKQYLAPIEQVNMKNPVNSEGNGNIIGIKQGAKKKKQMIIMDGKEDKHGYLVPITHKTRMKRMEVSQSEDDKEYLVPMKPAISEDDREYLIPMKHEANMKKQAISEDKDYLVPVTCEPNIREQGEGGKDKKQMTTMHDQENKNGYLDPIKHETKIKRINKHSHSEDDKEYLISMKRENTEKQVNLKELQFLVLMNEEANVIPVTPEDDEGYLVPLKQTVKANEKKQMDAEDDEYEYPDPIEQEIPMKQGENMEKYVNLKEMDYLVPINEKVNVINPVTSEDNEGYLVPVEQAAKANDKKQITEDEEDYEYEYPDHIEQEIPMKQGEKMEKYVNLKEMDYLVPINKEANVINPVTPEDNEGYLVPVEQAAKANDKKQITEDGDDEYEYLDHIEQEIPMKHGENMENYVNLKEFDYLASTNPDPMAQETRMMKMDKTLLSKENEEYIILIHQDANIKKKAHTISVHNKDYFSRKEKEITKDKKHKTLELPEKSKGQPLKKKKVQSPLAKSHKQMEKDQYKDKPMPLEKVQAQRIIYKKPANDVTTLLPQQPSISADELISQSKKLKPIVSRKTDRENKNRKTVVIGV